MSDLSVTIDLEDAELERALARAIEGGARLRQPMGEIVNEWEGAVNDRFAQERDPLGVPWAKRRDHGEPDAATHKLLQLTGHLKAAITYEFGDDFAEMGVQRTVGPGKYARIHNEGGTILPKNKKALSFGGRIVSRVVMPKRQFIGFGDRERGAVVGIMGDHLRGLFGAAGGAGA